MVLCDDAHTIATFFGREAGPPSAEWFCLMNEVVRIGIERQSRYILLGLGSYDAKSIVGAEIEPLYLYCRGTSRLMTWLMKLIPDLMRPPPRRARRIFRDDED
jgi:hypothetical protein